MKVLVVVDMQNDFIDGALGTPEAQAIVPKVVKKIEEFDGEVLWTQDTHSDDYLETQEGRLLPVKHCISASNGWQIHSSVKAAIQSKHQADDQLNGFEKKTFGSLALAQCGIRKSPLRLGTDIVKSSMSMQNALAMTMWFVRDSLAIFLCAGKRALKVQQRAQQLSA